MDAGQVIPCKGRGQVTRKALLPDNGSCHLSPSANNRERPTMIERIRELLAGYQPVRLPTEGRSLAAVLLLLYERENLLHIVFTKRTDLVEHHKGQVSFPGGVHDPADADLRRTAIRETFEEIGVEPGDIEIIGELDDIVTTSGFLITPYVGVLKRPGPYPFVFNADEVAEILEIPLDHLLDDANVKAELQEREGGPIVAYSYRFGTHVIWGATARITRQFLDLLTPVLRRVEHP